MSDRVVIIGSIDVVDPRPPGSGIVFGAAGPGLLCNTSAGVMSLDPEDPNGFVRYLRESGVPATPDDFVPRELVGRYCGDAFREHATGIEHRHVAARAVRVARHGAGYRIDLADGEQLTADDVVVATGTGSPVVPRAPSDTPIGSFGSTTARASRRTRKGAGDMARGGKETRQPASSRSAAVRTRLEEGC